MIDYFAYGSCMNRDDFRRTVPRFKVAGPAVLPDYKLAFTRFSSGRNGGVADIVFAEGSHVEGILYRFAPEYLPLLDEREGVSAGMYERICAHIMLNGERVQAYTYQIKHKEEHEVPPSEKYARLIWTGMEHDASDAYRQQFRQHIGSLLGQDLFLM